MKKLLLDIQTLSVRTKQSCNALSVVAFMEEKEILYIKKQLVFAYHSLLTWTMIHATCTIDLDY